LKALQQGIAHAPVETVASQSADLSVQIHRAHNLSRQVEVLHDALLHAFQDDKHLQPHDVVVLCADIQNAAPILEAVFDKTVKTSAGRSIRLPLVVADRTLKDISDGADLASNLLNLMTSRFDLESFMLVASSPLVMKNFGITASDLAVWTRHLENTRLRWGLDAEHRKVHGLIAPELNAHGWLEAIERALLGAVMNIGSDAPVMAGGIRPLPFVESSDSQALTKLVALLSILVGFESSSRHNSSVSNWCVETEKALLQLCGESCADLDDVLQILNSFQRASQALGSATYPVSFSEFAEYVAGELGASSGRLPLRSGSITATSFVPLRTVPFKVVCIVGFDDGTLPMGEPEGDDLIAATPMLGDGDPKVESRRVFLDALMSAEQRFIVTCTGRSIKNNNSVPLVTPLTEFLDFCRECGVDVPEEGDKLSAIEYSHPRHLGSPENFQPMGGPVPGTVWSHDPAGLSAAIERQKVLTSPQPGENDVENPVSQQNAPSKMLLSDLEILAVNPLKFYLRFGIKVHREWESGDVSNVLPLYIEGYDYSKICQDFFEGNITEDDLQLRLESADVLPISPLSEVAISATKSLVKGYQKEYRSVLSSEPETEDISLKLDNGCELKGLVERYHRPEQALSVVSFSKSFESDYARLAIRALAMIASGFAVGRAFLFHLNGGGTSAIKRILEIDDAITPQIAQQKLSALVALEPIARTVACPLFGDAAEFLYSADIVDDEVRREKSESAFDSFVGTSEVYSRSNELIVYGASPDFSDVYAKSKQFIAPFFSSYFANFDLQKIQGAKPQTWRLS
jgi:exodeoxyribonuclease V gamma subunit